MYYPSFAGQALASTGEQLCEHVYYSASFIQSDRFPISSTSLSLSLSLLTRKCAPRERITARTRASTRGPFGMRSGRRAVFDETLSAAKLSGGKKMSRSGYSGESQSFHQNTPPSPAHPSHGTFLSNNLAHSSS